MKGHNVEQCRKVLNMNSQYSYVHRSRELATEKVRAQERDSNKPMTSALPVQYLPSNKLPIRISAP